MTDNGRKFETVRLASPLQVKREQYENPSEGQTYQTFGIDCAIVPGLGQADWHFNMIEVHGGRELRERILVLLERHGMEDASLPLAGDGEDTAAHLEVIAECDPDYNGPLSQHICTIAAALIRSLAGRVEAEKRAKEEAQAACAFFADEGTYSDSYGVPGSDFGVCRFCEAGGAPGVPFEHNKSCPILRCEEVSAEWWTEREEERKDLTSAEARSAALARALEEAKEALRPFAEAASKAEISGYPPFQFCDARDYARARATLEPSHE